MTHVVYPNPFTNNGAFSVAGSATEDTFNAPVTGTGEFDVTGGATLEFNSSVSAGETIRVSSGMLEFGRNAGMQFLGTVFGADLNAQSVFKIDDGALSGGGALHMKDLTQNSETLWMADGHGNPEWQVHIATYCSINQFHETNVGSDAFISYTLHGHG